VLAGFAEGLARAEFARILGFKQLAQNISLMRKVISAEFKERL
jgi:hypothetical protein